jgi:DNA-directed RNA polymerase I, II, and III subunit RPABC1
MDTSSENVQFVYKSRNNLIQILEERGYKIDEYNEFSINDIGLMLTNKQLDLLLDNTLGNKIFVKYYLGKSLRPNNIQEIVDDLFIYEKILSKNDDLLIICKDEVNDSIKTTIKQIWDDHNIYIGICSIKRLQFNILKHSLVPKHSILSKEEEEPFMKRYNITDVKKLPEISRFDPVATAIGLRPNQICHIIRPSKTAITSDYYRLCYNK